MGYLVVDKEVVSWKNLNHENKNPEEAEFIRSKKEEVDALMKMQGGALVVSLPESAMISRRGDGLLDKGGVEFGGAKGHRLNTYFNGKTWEYSNAYPKKDLNSGELIVDNRWVFSGSNVHVDNFELAFYLLFISPLVAYEKSEKNMNEAKYKINIPARMAEAYIKKEALLAKVKVDILDSKYGIADESVVKLALAHGIPQANKQDINIIRRRLMEIMETGITQYGESFYYNALSDTKANEILVVIQQAIDQKIIAYDKKLNSWGFMDEKKKFAKVICKDLETYGKSYRVLVTYLESDSETLVDIYNLVKGTPIPTQKAESLKDEGNK